MKNLVVIHSFEGQISKGVTGDFFPNKQSFHLQDHASGQMSQIYLQDLKAIYFVKDLDGDSGLDEKTDAERTGFGRKIQVCFKDGEVQNGYTQGYAPNRPGFFVTPCDENSNNIRIFVVTTATEKVQFV